MIRAALVAVALASSIAPGSTPSSPPPSDGVIVEIEPTNRSVVLGDDLDLTVTVTNGAGRPSADLVAHLDITDPRRSTSVDPEDWTSTLSQPIGVLEPGQVGTVRWNIQPISPGTFSVYAVAISSESRAVAASSVLTVEVADQRSLNPGGILPVAIGMPALVGALLVARALAAKRATRPAAA